LKLLYDEQGFGDANPSSFWFVGRTEGAAQSAPAKLDTSRMGSRFSSLEKNVGFIR